MEQARTIPPDALIAWVVIIAVFASVGLLLLVRLGAAIERRLRRRGQPAAVKAPGSPGATRSAGAPTAPRPQPPGGEVLAVGTWLPLLFERAAHIVILGGSGSGKTRTARGLVRYIVEQRREQVVILDPKANRDTWMGLPALVRPADIDQAMKALLAEFQRRLDLNPTLTEAEAEAAFTRVWVMVDEVSFVRDNCKPWPSFLKRISSMARSLKLHLIIVNQSERVDELGLKGRGDLLANFARIALSPSVWDGEPASIEIGAQTIRGAWLEHFPHAYQGRALPVTAISGLVRHREPSGSQEPVPAPGTALESREPGFESEESEGGDTGTGSVPVRAANEQAAADTKEETEEEKIRRLARSGLSHNQIAEKLGGRRQKTLARIRAALHEVVTV